MPETGFAKMSLLGFSVNKGPEPLAAYVTKSHTHTPFFGNVLDHLPVADGYRSESAGVFAMSVPDHVDKRRVCQPLVKYKFHVISRRNGKTTRSTGKSPRGTCPRLRRLYFAVSRRRRRGRVPRGRSEE